MKVLRYVRILYKILLGANLVALKQLLLLELRKFGYACSGAFDAAIRPKSHDLASIPTLSLDDILGARYPGIYLRMSPQEDGALPSNQVAILLSILVAESPKEVLEIGTFMGHTTRQMAENLPNSIIHTIDLPQEFNTDKTPSSIPMDDFHLIKRRIVGREFKTEKCSQRIRQHFGDTATFDFKTAGEPTFFFIDGSHTYEYCKNDSEKCFELCNGKGVFLWHDCDSEHPGVVKLIHEWRELGRDIRVIRDTPIAYWENRAK